MDWNKVAKKCTTEVLLNLHFKEVIDKVEKIKENLDLVLSIYI